MSGVATVSTGACSEAGGSDQGGASVGVAASARGGAIHSEAGCCFKAACLLIGCSALGATDLQSRVKNEAP